MIVRAVHTLASPETTTSIAHVERAFIEGGKAPEAIRFRTGEREAL
jgi:hypothetical protein